MSPDAVAPADAPKGTCWDKTTSPAVIRTVTRRVLVTPADISAEGTIRAPAEYRKEDSREIVTPRQTTWTEILCPEAFTPEFTASLQRALAARGYYDGIVTGRMDTATSKAITDYQTANGITAGQLSTQAAVEMGLVVKKNQ